MIRVLRRHSNSTTVDFSQRGPIFVGAPYSVCIQPMAMGNTTHGPRRSFLQRLVNAFFGYDFFISHARADGGTYAQRLAIKLNHDHNFECFLDTDSFVPGDDWKRVGAWALKRSSLTVYIATKQSLNSEAVRWELETFQ